jgi:hypothetical protein
MITTRRRGILSVHEQLPRMRAFPGFTSWLSGTRLIAEGEVHPSSLGAIYRVRIEYEVKEFPKVWVLSPELIPREKGGEIPHMYGQERLCLYLPGTGEWSGRMSLGHTIIPWISLWLHYYELWHATGEWLGGGVEPTVEKPFIRDRKFACYEPTQSQC